MTDAEAIMWAVERDPALRSDFCNLTLLEQRPSEDRLRATLARALRAIPRLRQRVVAAPLRLVPPDFADDPALDVDAHVRELTVPAPGDDHALLASSAELADEPLDRNRPLWEFVLLDGLTGGRAALLQRIHHTITDGVGGLRLSRALVDLEPDPPLADTPRPGDAPGADSPPPRRDGTIGSARAAVVDATARNVGAARRVAAGASRVLRHPTEVPGRAGDAARVVASIRRQALIRERARSDVMVERSVTRRFETADVSLEDLRRAARALGGSVNDAYVTALAGALGRYHERAGSDVTELRLAMPVSTRRTGEDAPNRFVPSRVLVPIRPFDDVPSLFAEIHERLAAAKREAAFSVADDLAAVVSALPAALLVAMTRSQTRTVDFAASNLRGSPVPLYLAGSRIVASYPFGPRTGTPLNVTALSYCDRLMIGLNIDPAAIDDPDELVRDLADSFDAVLARA